MSQTWLERTLGPKEEKEEEEIVPIPRFKGEPITAFKGGRSLNWKSKGKEEKVTTSASLRERKRKRHLALSIYLRCLVLAAFSLIILVRLQCFLSAK